MVERSVGSGIRKESRIIHFGVKHPVLTFKESPNIMQSPSNARESFSADLLYKELGYKLVHVQDILVLI